MSLPSRERIEGAIKHLQGIHQCDSTRHCGTCDCVQVCLSVLTALKDGEIVAKPVVTEEAINKIVDSCMYDFPKHYTNAQILAFQKGIDKVWKALADCREALKKG